MKTTFSTFSVTKTVAGAVALATAILFCAPASAALTHHYKFDEGSGTTFADSAGSADGTISGNAALTAAGLELNLDPASGRDGLGSILTSATDAINGVDIQSYSELTVELWATPATDTATPNPNDGFSTTVAFGKVNGTDPGLFGEYFLLQTHRGDDRSQAALSFSDDGSPWDEEEFATGTEHNDGQTHHYRAAVTATGIRLYVDGVFAGSSPLTTNSLASVSNELAWLGDAYPNDQNWAGTIHELKIYDEAIPEPATLVLLAVGGLAVCGVRKRSL